MATAVAPRGEVARHSRPTTAARVLSLDVFRGLTMILLISHGFGMIEALKGSQSWIATQFDHAEWAGCTLWDLIQPAFTFIVGAALPFARRRRLSGGQSQGEFFRHAAWRATLLIVLSNVLSNWGNSHPPKLQLINVLCQIGLGYLLCTAISQMPFRLQVAAGTALFVGYQALFFLFPGPSGPFDQTGNIGAVLDRMLLGYNYSGHYTTLNFLGNAVTILFGVWTGMLFLHVSEHRRRLQILGACSAAAFLTGHGLSFYIPMVKRLWTGSFTLFSAGWVLLALMALYWAVEVQGWKKWTFPAVVVGTNCIFIYSFSQVLRGWLSRGIASFDGNFWFLGQWGAVPHNLLVLSAMWYLCYWLYRREIFFKI